MPNSSSRLRKTAPGVVPPAVASKENQPNEEAEESTARRSTKKKRDLDRIRAMVRDPGFPAKYKAFAAMKAKAAAPPVSLVRNDSGSESDESSLTDRSDDVAIDQKGAARARATLPKGDNNYHRMVPTKKSATGSLCSRQDTRNAAEYGSGKETTVAAASLMVDEDDFDSEEDYFKGEGPSMYTHSDFDAKLAEELTRLEASLQGKMEAKFRALQEDASASEARYLKILKDHTAMRKECLDVKVELLRKTNEMNSMCFFVDEELVKLGVDEVEKGGRSKTGLLRLLVEKLEAKIPAPAAHAENSALNLTSTFICPYQPCPEKYTTDARDKSNRVADIRLHCVDCHAWVAYPKGAAYAKVKSNIFDRVVTDPVKYTNIIHGSRWPFLAPGETIRVPIEIQKTHDKGNETLLEQSRDSFTSYISSSTLNRTASVLMRQNKKIHKMIRFFAVPNEWRELLMMQLLVNWFDDRCGGRSHQRNYANPYAARNGRYSAKKFLSNDSYDSDDEAADDPNDAQRVEALDCD